MMAVLAVFTVNVYTHETLKGHNFVAFASIFIIFDDAKINTETKRKKNCAHNTAAMAATPPKQIP